MKKILAAIGISLLLASTASPAAARERDRRSIGKPVANPSAIVKAELSFARLAREEGQWTAFRETAADDAVMFVPNLTNAQQWLKGKADPAAAVEWQPHKIFMSCDGSMALSTGAWQRADRTTGRFFTIWQQQNFGKRKRGKKAEWKWVFDHGVALEAPLEEPDFVETEIASCKGNVTAETAPEGATGGSWDYSLQWIASGSTENIRALNVRLWNGLAFDTVIDEQFPAAK